MIKPLKWHVTRAVYAILIALYILRKNKPIIQERGSRKIVNEREYLCCNNTWVM